MYSLKKKYSKPDLEIVDKILSHVPENKDKEDLNMLVANIHFPTICYSWKSEEDFNNLLSKYKIDVSVFEKEKDSYEKKTENNEVFNMIVEIISKNPNEYKKEIISTIKNKLPNLPKGKVSSTIRKYCKLGLIEQSNHLTTNKKILSKGRYWTSYMGRK